MPPQIGELTINTYMGPLGVIWSLDRTVKGKALGEIVIMLVDIYKWFHLDAFRLHLHVGALPELNCPCQDV